MTSSVRTSSRAWTWRFPPSSMVSRQTYDAATLAGPLSNQVAALKAAGAQVVAMATIPAATALAMLPAVGIGYNPQYVISNVGADAPTVGPLLSSFTPKGGGTAAQAAAAGGLLNGVITDSYFAPESDTSQSLGAGREEALCRSTPRASTPSQGLDGNTQYGHRPGLHLRPGAAGGREEPDPGRLAGGHCQVRQEVRHPGFVPLSYSSSVALRIPRRRGRQAAAARRHRPSRLPVAGSAARPSPRLRSQMWALDR